MRGLLLAAHRHVVAHVRAAHVEFDNVRAGGLEAPRHVHPAHHAGLVADVRDVGHEEKFLRRPAASVLDQPQPFLHVQARLGAEREETLVIPPAVARLQAHIRLGVERQLDAGRRPAVLRGLDEMVNGLRRRAGAHVERVAERDPADLDGQVHLVEIHFHRTTPSVSARSKKAVSLEGHASSWPQFQTNRTRRSASLHSQNCWTMRARPRLTAPSHSVP